MKTYEVTARVISPFHITGNTLYNLDYYWTGGCIHIVDWGNVVNKLTGNDIRKIENIFKNGRINNLSNNEKIVFLKNFSVRRKIRFIPSSPREQIKRQIFEMVGEGRYVPGSSIKGSIRVSLLRWLIRNGDIDIDKYIRAYFKSRNKSRENRVDSPVYIDEMLKYMGKDDQHRDMFRGLSISDSLNGILTEIMKVIRMNENRSKSGNPYAEFAVPDQELKFIMKIDDNIFSLDEIEKSLRLTYKIAKKYEKNVIEIESGVPLILGRFTGIFTKTLLGLEAEGLVISKYINVCKMANKKKILSTLRDGKRKAPMYVKYGNKKMYPGLLSLDFKEIG